SSSWEVISTIHVHSYRLDTCSSESTIPTIVQSVGVSSRLKGKLASFPRHQKTNSPTPAPAASTATRGLPCGSRFLSRDRTTSSLRWCSESFLTVATTVPITRASCISFLGSHNIDRVDYADDRGIDRRVFHILRQSRARTGDDQHAFMKACADRIDGDDVAACVRPIDVDGPNNSQLFSFQSLVLLRSHDCANDPRDDHARAAAVTGMASSTLPCGRGMTWTLTNSPT